jgi:hypothetical protein
VRRNHHLRYSSTAFIDVDNIILQVFISASLPFIGFLAYDVVYACVGASLDRGAGVSWRKEFLRHMRFSSPLILICLSIGLFLSFIFIQVGEVDVEKAYLFTLLVNYCIV